jgi:hypothetical protein
MEYPAPKFEAEDGQKYELLSLEEYKVRLGQPDISNPTLVYQMQNDKLDYVKLGTFRYIIFNERAQNMKLKSRRPRQK